MTAAPRLEVRALVRGYPGLAVLCRVDLAVAAGEVVAVRGASGTGKSTLLNCLGLLDRPESGSIVLDGRDLTTLGPAPRAMARARDLGFVFQAFHLLPEFDVLENVLMAARCARLPLAAARTRARDLLARVGLDGRARAAVATLSGGERQRVALCRALLCRPRLVLADEPTGNLDPVTAQVVLRELEDLARRDGAAVVLVTHDDAVAATADRRLILREGRLHPADAI
jgi:ABC-type lipoprotein export system ATPase subunit